MVGKKKTLYIEDDVLKDLEQDTFGHKHIAEAVVDSILNTKPPFTIGIFGGWGTGKSSLLEIVKSSLPQNNVVTVTIDAWRYSSAENLRRAFLVHVAQKLAPNLLHDLRRKLYTSEQETLPGKKSQLDDQNISFWKNVFEVLKTFLGLALIFFGFLAIIYLTKALIQGLFTGEYTFDWEDLLTRFIDLAFIPFLLTFVNYLRLYIVQRPVTVIYERIDAEELFADYFNKVVEKATSKKKLLVIFIDNLDRLQGEKLVEALESLKTYINNDRCIFVVACDNNVVSSVVNASLKIPKIDDSNQEDGRAGEHYLDKFFQQTFRIPEYMGINLHDYARKNFKTTNLYEELSARNIDIRNFISIILPSDVSSPRKVKRLLNEFIALFEIIKRRESKSNGQIRPGLLSNNVEFLGKFSTIRAEYPDFYKLLLSDSTFLSKVTESLQQKEKTDELFTGGREVTNLKSLLSYLMKTQTILVDDLDPYIWLSQDTLALGIPGSQYNQLRTSLADGNVEQVASILNSAENHEKESC